MVMFKLDDIALGDASADEARKIIRSALQDGGGGAAESIYRALRAWTWKCLSDGRRDDELRSWHEIMNRTGAYLEEDHKSFADKVTVLKELLSESITAADRLDLKHLLQRDHVRDILFEVYRSPNRRAQRAALKHALKLGEANLSRVLNMVVAARLLDRTSYGKRAAFTLSQAGLQALRMIVEQDAAAASRRASSVGSSGSGPVKDQHAREVQHSKDLLHSKRSEHSYPVAAFSKLAG